MFKKQFLNRSTEFMKRNNHISSSFGFDPGDVMWFRIGRFGWFGRYERRARESRTIDDTAYGGKINGLAGLPQQIENF